MPPTPLPAPPTSEARVWRALADPTRRRILDELRRAPLPAGKLAGRFEMTRFGVRKHLVVLREAGLVLVERRGRERWHRLNPVPIRELYRRWIRPFEEEGSDRLLRIRQLAESDLSTREPTPTDPMTTTEAATIGTNHIVCEVLIEAPLERVWKAMVEDTSAWWHEDFYTAADPVGFHIEPVLGGRMWEDWGDGAGQIWGNVNGLRAPEFLQVVGDSSAEWGGPSRGIMTWTLAHENGTTTLRLEHSIFGRISKQTEESLEAGWKQLFGDCLKRFVETGD